MILQKKDFSPAPAAKKSKHPFASAENERVRLKLVCITAAQDFTRFIVVGCSAISFPSMKALQLVVIVSASSKLIVNACM